MASTTGRLLRATAGFGLVYVGLFLWHDGWQLIALIIGGVLFLSGLLDTCALGLLSHGTVKGSQIRGGKPKSVDKQVTIMLFTLGAVVFTVLALTRPDSSTNNTDTSKVASLSPVASAPSETTQAAVLANAQSQNDMLVYLIEEEKLAHDAYSVLHDLYGARVFGNILNSEQTHQSRVQTLLQARNVADPRTNSIGTFANQELQKLYDQLIAQGKQSAEEAYKVGVAIEEKDIADITKQLATATDTDVVSALEALRSGSENHLRAFNRQLGRY